MGIEMQREKCAQLFREVDIDEDDGLDAEEFLRAINCPSELEQWSSTLPLAKLLGCCLETAMVRALVDCPSAQSDPIRKIVCMSSQDINTVADEFGEGLRRLVTQKVKELKQCFWELDKKAAEGSDGSSAKFQTFAMSAGTVEDFHKGLIDRVGKPTEHANISVDNYTSVPWPDR